MNFAPLALLSQALKVRNLPSSSSMLPSAKFLSGALTGWLYKYEVYVFVSLQSPWQLVLVVLILFRRRSKVRRLSCVIVYNCCEFDCPLWWLKPGLLLDIFILLDIIFIWY